MSFFQLITHDMECWDAAAHEREGACHFRTDLLKQRVDLEGERQRRQRGNSQGSGRGEPDSVTVEV